MKLPDEYFQGAETILDVGGWFMPEPRATHVVDIMPWETRGLEVRLERRPGERFSRETWFQVDFLQPGLKFPFADKSFDLVVCGQTVEDLDAPEALLREMERVGRRGVIECPSRIMEQTKGVRDRERREPGHPHHHWIVESTGGQLLLCSKHDSDLSEESRLLPLLFTEREVMRGAQKSDVTHVWTDRINFRIVRGEECRRRAEEFVSSLKVPLAVRLKDKALRLARRIRSRLRGTPPENFEWRTRVLELSRPYSSIELK